MIKKNILGFLFFHISEKTWNSEKLLQCMFVMYFDQTTTELQLYKIRKMLIGSLYFINHNLLLFVFCYITLLKGYYQIPYSSSCLLHIRRLLINLYHFRKFTWLERYKRENLSVPAWLSASIIFTSFHSHAY